MDEVSNTYGHSYYYYDELNSYLPRVLGVIPEETRVEECLKELELDLLIMHKENRYYLKEMYEAETLIVKRLRMLNNNKERVEKKLDDNL